MTGYRDETETLRARVEELEGKLSGAQAEIAKLRGEEAPVTPAASRDPLVGEVLHHVDERQLDFQVSERGYEAIASLVRERLRGQVAQVGRSLTGPGFSLTAGEGWTRVRLETDERSLRAAVLSGPVMTGLFAGLPTLGLLLDLGQHAAISPWHAAWAIPAILIGGGVGMRAVAARRARARKTAHDALLAAIVSLAEEHRIVDEKVVRVRVAVEEGAGEPEEAAAEEREESSLAAQRAAR